MISPSEIEAKATRLLPRAIDAWLAGKESESFPWLVPSNLRLSDIRSENIRDVELLRQSSKEVLGYGYSVRWESRNSRIHGQNDYFPKAIYIESLTDLLKLTGYSSAFRRLERSVKHIRDRLPSLESWIARSWKLLEPLEFQVVSDLVTAAEYLIANPRPNCFVRELPLAIPTKLIKNYKSLFASWLNALLPDDAIDCSGDPKDFEQRFGFRYFEQHVLMRVLDPALQPHFSLITSEFSLPPRVIRSLDLNNVRVVLVENQVTLLTFPTLPRGLAFFGMGKNIIQYFHCEWLRRAPILYWGDLDVQGFEILAMLRRQYPQTQSMLMDLPTVQEYEHLATSGTGHSPNTPAELDERETESFHYLRSKNLRIEQEHILQSRVDRWFSSHSTNLFTILEQPSNRV